MRHHWWAKTPLAKRKYPRMRQLWPKDFTAKLSCNVEFWLERPPKLIEPLPEFAVDLRAGFLALAP
jgi:hypothetical protein